MYSLALEEQEKKVQHASPACGFKKPQDQNPCVLCPGMKPSPSLGADRFGEKERKLPQLVVLLCV